METKDAMAAWVFRALTLQTLKIIADTLDVRTVDLVRGL
jgi:hypothetical protein